LQFFVKNFPNWLNLFTLMGLEEGYFCSSAHLSELARTHGFKEPGQCDQIRRNFDLWIFVTLAKLNINEAYVPRYLQNLQ
jgi:hypothetical protein